MDESQMISDEEMDEVEEIIDDEEEEEEEIEAPDDDEVEEIPPPPVGVAAGAGHDEEEDDDEEGVEDEEEEDDEDDEDDDEEGVEDEEEEVEEIDSDEMEEEDEDEIDENSVADSVGSASNNSKSVDLSSKIAAALAAGPVLLPPGISLTKVASKVTSSAKSSRSGTETPPTRTATPRRGRPAQTPKATPGPKPKAAAAPAAASTPAPRKRPGRKPRSPETKARLKEEKKQQKAEERKEKRKEKAREKAAAKAAEKAAKKKGPRKLTDEEKKSREDARKAKYEEIKRKKAEVAEKRRLKNEELREKRKAKKAEEQRQREAYEKRMQELKASFLDETSQMSGDGAPIMGDGDMDGGGNSQDASNSASGAKTARVFGIPGVNEMSNLAPIKSVTASNLLEYRWPLEGKDSEYYFLQEQVSEYLDIKSFKRRYPDLSRRNVFNEERDFLVEMGVVSVTQADLGLTAIPAAQILDIMSNDFYDKYEEYRTVVVERKDRTMRQTNYSLANVESGQMADFVRNAMKSVANWNKTMNQERREKRAAYFDMQTFAMHYPMTGKGRMEMIKKPNLGHYPIALIPGQFVDHYDKLTPAQLKYLPLNTALKAPPTKERLRDLAGSEESDSSSSDDDSDDSGSSSSGSDSEDENENSKNTENNKNSKNNAEDKSKNAAAAKIVTPAVAKTEPAKPKRAVDAEVPGATCGLCGGDRKRNKNGVPEKLLHCTKCDSSFHPTCAGLVIDLLEHVTSYNWECTDCKGCTKCNDHSDEDKMIFCDLCDRGYHIYCVGLDSIPSGRWHCDQCAKCSSCGCKEPNGGVDMEKTAKWSFEYKTGSTGDKIFSHMMCNPCHKLWKRAMFCPECNVCFGREKSESMKKYFYCWVCSRQHHAACVGQERFICNSCQIKTLAKRVNAGNHHLTSGYVVVGGGGGGGGSGGGGDRETTGRTPGRGARRSNINYANFG